MNIKTQMGWASFLVALSAFNLPIDATIAPQFSPTATTQSSIENRLTQISATLKAKASQLPDNASEMPGNANLALGWANAGGGGGGSFVNLNRGSGWRNGGGGWRNGWSDGGSFFNRR